MTEYTIQSDALQMTQHGLAFAIGLIPKEVKRKFTRPAYKWKGEYTQNGKRYLVIIIQEATS